MESKKIDRDKEKAKRRANAKQQPAKVIRLKVSLRSLRGLSSGNLPLKNNEIYL
jgi:hypothetical protein